jgi:hypothetical protein
MLAKVACDMQDADQSCIQKVSTALRVTKAAIEGTSRGEIADRSAVLCMPLSGYRYPRSLLGTANVRCIMSAGRAGCLLHSFLQYTAAEGQARKGPTPQLIHPNTSIHLQRRK